VVSVTFRLIQRKEQESGRGLLGLRLDGRRHAVVTFHADSKTQRAYLQLIVGLEFSLTPDPLLVDEGVP
jgi:hypothetical protein